MSTATQTIKQQIPAGTYVVDPVHSSIGFAVTHNGVSTFRSGFAAYEARLTAARAPRLEGAVDVGSIEIAEEQLKGHLLSPEFFDAERYPRLRFESSELSVDEDGAASVRGELEIGGESREVEASGRFAPARRRPRRQRPGRALARGDGRPPRLRPRLAGRAAERRRGARLAGRDRGRAGAGRGGRVAMRVLGISGSLRRGSLNTRPAAGGRRAAARRGRAGRVRAARRRSRPTTRTSTSTGRRARRPRRCASCARRSATPTRS